MSNIIGGLDILRQWRFSAVLEHQAAAVRMTLNPAWKIDFTDPEDVQTPLQQVADARRQVSSSVTAKAAAASEKPNNKDGAKNDDDKKSSSLAAKQMREQMPKMFLVPFLAFTDETMAPKRGASDLLSGFSVGWAATIKRVKMFYASLPPPLHQPAVVSAEDEADELEVNRMKAWCKRCVQHVLDDNRVVSIDGNKKLRKLRTKTMLSPEQRITLGQHHHGFRFNIVYEQKGEMTPHSNAVALCVCSRDHGYMILIECVSRNELESYVSGVLVKSWLSDAKRFELGADIQGYSDCSHAALQLQQSLFGELVFTDNDAAISFRIPMHPMTLRPDHSPTVPPATGSLCCVTLDLLLHQKLLDTLEEDEASAVGGKSRLVNVVLVIEVEDLLKEPNFPTVFSGDAYSQRRHEQFTEVFRDSRVIGLPLSVPVGRRTGRSTTCTFSTVMNDTQALVKSTTVTTLVGSHGASATYFTKLGQGMFDQYLYLYQHLLKTLTFFAERDISGTFSRYRSVPIRILEADLAACYPHRANTDPTARLNALQKHITALRATSDGEVDGMQMTDIVRIDESMMNEATGSASAKMASAADRQQEQDQQQKQVGEAFSENVPDESDEEKEKQQADGEDQQQQQRKQQAASYDNDLDDANNNNNNNNIYYDELQHTNSRRFTDIDSVITVTDIGRLMTEDIAMLDEEEVDELSRSQRPEGESDPSVINGSPSAQQQSNRTKSPTTGNNNNDTTVEGGEQQILMYQNTNDGTMNATAGGATHHLLDTTLGGGGGGETPSEMLHPAHTSQRAATATPSRLSSQHNQQQGTSNQVTSHTGGRDSVGVNADDGDRSAQSLGDDNRTNIGYNNDNNQQQDNNANRDPLTASNLAAVGGTTPQRVSIVEPGTTDNKDTPTQQPDSFQQQGTKGKPTQQQLQDLADALALIGDGKNKQGGGANNNEENLDGGLNETTRSNNNLDAEDDNNNQGGGGKKSGSSKHQQGGSTSSLRNSYIELCKDGGCRPNSYLLQKLPAIPRIAQTIEALDMSHNYVGHSGFVAILRLLDLLPRVHSVYFNSMSLDNQDVVVLCDTLAEHTTIHSVFLKNNPRITLPAAKSFFRLLKDNINIHTITLTGTGIGLALQQRIEKEANSNKEIQMENEKRRKSLQQQQQQIADGENISGDLSHQQKEAGGTMITLTVGAPGKQKENSINSTEEEDQQQQQHHQGDDESVSSGTKNPPSNTNDDDDDATSSDQKNNNKKDHYRQQSSAGSTSPTPAGEMKDENRQTTSGTPLQKEGTAVADESQGGGGGVVTTSSQDRVVVG